MQTVVIVGSAGGSHIGESLARAALTSGIAAKFCDTRAAWRHQDIRQKLLWRFADKWPLRLRQFEDSVLQTCCGFSPATIIATGMAPLTAKTIVKLRRSGANCINFSTDDPFNRQHRSSWFLEALKEYDLVFTPRRANIDELRAHGCRYVEYLPFGYDSELFFPVTPVVEMMSDILFAGVGDEDRVPYIEALLNAGFDVRLHGINWERYSATKDITRGQADISMLRQAIASCQVALCLVRRSNRDGHSMRTFELPAVGACMVVEDTREHRDIFGDDESCVLYFADREELITKMKPLLGDCVRRAKLRAKVHRHITSGRNTYADRLRQMLNSC